MKTLSKQIMIYASFTVLIVAMAGQVKVGKCNVDEAPKISERFEIRSIPTLIILKDNQEVERFVGVQREADLISTLKKHIK